MLASVEDGNGLSGNARRLPHGARSGSAPRQALHQISQNFAEFSTHAASSIKTPEVRDCRLTLLMRGFDKLEHSQTNYCGTQRRPGAVITTSSSSGSTAPC
jgi:hypothetical protein